MIVAFKGKNPALHKPYRLFQTSLNILKPLPFFLFFFAVSIPVCYCGEVTLTWNPPNQYVDGYRIYYARAGSDLRSGLMREVRPMQQTSCTISGLEPGATYFFAASSFLGYRESGLSSAVGYRVPEEAGSSAENAGEGGCFIRVTKK